MECRICGSNRGRRFQAREMMFGLRETFEYFECADCRSLQIASLPTDLSRYYPSQYYSFQEPGNRGGIKAVLRRLRNRFALTGRGSVGRMVLRIRPTVYLSSLRSLRPLRLGRTESILDVGAGTGSLVRDLRELGFVNAVGVDPLVPDMVEDRGRPLVMKDTLEGMTGAWDVVMFHHSFEHIWDQAGTLRRAAGLLSPAGRILVRMPVVAEAWATYGPDWVQLDAPRHLTVHSIRSFQLLADHAGLEIVDTEWDSTSVQFLASEQYRADVPLLAPDSWVIAPSRSPFSPDQLERFEERARELNRKGLGDQACFYLRPRGATKASG